MNISLQRSELLSNDLGIPAHTIETLSRLFIINFFFSSLGEGEGKTKRTKVFVRSNSHRNQSEYL